MRLRRLSLDLPQPPGPGEIVTLDAAQSRHGLKVLRLTTGQPLELVGPWGIATAEVFEVHPASFLKVRLIGPWLQEIHSGPRLALALIRSSRFDWAVEKATELGASELIPIHTSRTTPSPGQAETKKNRWHRISEEARKQCGRTSQLIISDPLAFPIFTAMPALTNEPRILLDPSGDAWPSLDFSQSPLVAVGPEGGFTDEEIKMAKEANFMILNLGNGLLRAETAALAALSFLRLTTSSPQALSKD